MDNQIPPTTPPSGQALPSSEQALPSSEQALPSSGQALPSSGQALPSSGQALPSSGQAASTPVTPAGTAYTPPPTMTPPPTIQEPVSPPKKSPWMLIIIVLVLLGLIGGGTYYYMNMRQSQSVTPKKVVVKSTPTIMPTETPMASPTAMASDSANWKTYTSLDGTYSIQYPSETFLRYICPEEELTLEKRLPSEKEESINMSTCGRDGLYDIEIITLKQPSIPPHSDENYSITKKDIIVDGIPASAYTRTLTNEPEGQYIAFSEDIYVTKNGKYYQIHLGQKDLQSTFDKMLASFKFTK